MGQVELVVIDEVHPLGLVILHDRVVKPVAPQNLVREVRGSNLCQLNQIVE